MTTHYDPAANGWTFDALDDEDAPVPVRWFKHYRGICYTITVTEDAVFHARSDDDCFDAKAPTFAALVEAIEDDAYEDDAYEDDAYEDEQPGYDSDDAHDERQAYYDAEEAQP